MLDLLADDEQRALEPFVSRALGLSKGGLAQGRADVGLLVASVPPAVGDEYLLDDRFRRARRGAEARIVARHFAPAQDGMPFGADGLLDQLAQRQSRVLVFRQKDEACAIPAHRRQGEAEVRRRLAEEPIRHLNEDAGAVARVGFAPAGAAVQQVEEHLQPFLDDPVRLAALDVDDETDAAGVVLVAGIVEGYRAGRAGRGGRHGLPVITWPESEVKYNDPIGSIRSWNG